MHGSTLLDAKGDVVRPALLWCDQRTDAQCRADHRHHRGGTSHRADAEPGPHRASRCPSCCGSASTSPRRWARRAIGAAAQGLRALPADRRQGHRRRRRLRHAAPRRRRSAHWSETMLRELDLDPSLMPEVFESPDDHRAACRARVRRPPGSRSGRPSSPAAAIRRRVRSAWASCGRGRSARRSARRASSLPPPIGPRSSAAAASTPSVTPCRDAGTSWA